MKQNKLMVSSVLVTICILALVLTNGNSTLSEDGSYTPSVTSEAKKLIVLPTVGTEEKFSKLVKEYDYTKERWGLFSFLGGTAKTADSAVGQAENGIATTAAAPKENASADFSGTNVQVQGVDEADIIKTDGKYIYHVGDRRVNIISALPSDKMELLSTIDFSRDNLNILELYLDESTLTVLLTGWNDYKVAEPQNDTGNIKANAIAKPYYGDSYVKAMVYDIKDRKKPELIKETTADGNYISSRKIGSFVYVVTNKNINFRYWHDNDTVPLPYFKDSAAGTEPQSLTFEDIRYFPEICEPNFLNILSFDTADAVKKANMQSFLGAGSTIYSSPENLYVVSNARSNNSSIMKFALDGTEVNPVAKGEVEGYLINQFSMDENKGYFRVATNNHKSNSLFVLDDNLKLKGKIEDIAPTERIYSVRFMGDRAYMVTFKNTDPLFAIDLKDPENPKIMGQLKIPGFSNYLHPYDENHIIGFGKDTVEMEYKGVNGSAGRTVAYTLGMKISVFDVTDIENPKEMYVEKIGDRGTESPLLQNHKALLFSKDKELIAFPVNVNIATSSNKTEFNGMPQYGTPVFQGAYVYNFNLETGFKLKGRITNMKNDEILKSGYSYNNKNQIERIIYIGDVLYTVSDNRIKSSSMNDLTEYGSLELPTAR